MVDLKEFWDSKRQKGVYFTRGENAPLIRKELGLFFWERGGKQFVQQHNGGLSDGSKGWINPTFESKLKEAQSVLLNDERYKYGGRWNLTARDYLDALACLGEDKIKELIKELK